MSKAKLVGINTEASSTIHGSELMVLLKDFELILKSNPQIDFAVRYAIEKTAGRHISTINKLENKIVDVNREFLKFGEDGQPVMNGADPTYSEGKDKDSHIKKLTETMNETYPFNPHRLEPVRLNGVILDTSKSDFRVFQNYMIVDESE